ncbi:MAG: YggT family protein [Alphaproteobacteria bacterium]|nr:YggT family protein [Alphaproteobacteria bacterium]
MVPVVVIVIYVIDLYWWIVIIAAVFSWLMAFGVIDTRNHAVRMVANFLYRATEPALRPIQRVLPNFGGIDISPVILLLILWLIEMELGKLIYYLSGG